MFRLLCATFADKVAIRFFHYYFTSYLTGVNHFSSGSSEDFTNIIKF